MTPAKWIGELFQCIDVNDTEEFLSYLTHDALFRSGNAPAVHGQVAIRAAIEGFFDSIKRSRHELRGHCACGDTVICQGEVTWLALSSVRDMPSIDVARATTCPSSIPGRHSGLSPVPAPMRWCWYRGALCMCASGARGSSRRSRNSTCTWAARMGPARCAHGLRTIKS